MIEGDIGLGDLLGGFLFFSSPRLTFVVRQCYMLCCVNWLGFFFLDTFYLHCGLYLKAYDSSVYILVIFF